MQYGDRGSHWSPQWKPEFDISVFYILVLMKQTSLKTGLSKEYQLLSTAHGNTSVHSVMKRTA